MTEVPAEPRATEERSLRRLVDLLPAMVAYWDQDARNVIANAAYREWFGYSPEEMAGLHISEVLGPEVYAKNRQYIEGALHGEVQSFERALTDQRGRVRHTQASYVPDVVDGTTRGFVVLVTDVTARVEAQRAMDEAQALAHLGSWTLDMVSDEIAWSLELFRIVGRDPRLGPPASLAEFTAYIHPDDRPRVLEGIGRAVSSAGAYTHEYRMLHADGHVREVVSNGRPVTDQGGTVVRLTGTLQDITESKALARELSRVNDELTDANAVKADVLGMLGHDITTPLAVVRGYLELLDDHAADLDDDGRRALVARALKATNGIADLVRTILATAADDSRRGRHSPAVGLLPVIDEAVALCGMEDVVRVQDDAADAVVAFDRSRLVQVLSNLLTNAARYGAAPIRIHVRREDGGIAVGVSDAGPGVPADQVEHLFTRFARTGEAQQAAGGTGFGLYISAQLAAAHAATLAYVPGSEDEPHEFRLLVAEAHDAAAAS